MIQIKRETCVTYKGRNIKNRVPTTVFCWNVYINGRFASGGCIVGNNTQNGKAKYETKKAANEFIDGFLGNGPVDSVIKANGAAYAKKNNHD